jgi:hypothetical protein
MVISSFGGRDVDVVTASSRHFPSLLERCLGGLPAVKEFAVLAHRFYGKVHFFFFLSLFFFLMISAWVLKACAKDLISLATNVSAVLAATRSAVTACRRIALAIFIEDQFSSLCVVPDDKALILAA